MGYSPLGCKELGTTDKHSHFFSLHGVNPPTLVGFEPAPWYH